MVDAAVIRPVSWPEAERLVSIDGRTRKLAKGQASWQEWMALSASKEVFDGVAAWRSGTRALGEGQLEEVRVFSASSQFFEMLDAKPVAGRVFDRAEDESASGSAPLAGTGHGEIRLPAPRRSTPRSAVTEGF